MFIKEIIREIAKYLEGGYLLHFKLTCKEIRDFLYDIKVEPLKVNKYNFKRTFLIPGIHLVELNHRVNDWLYSIGDTSMVTNLILDFSKCKASISFDYLLEVFKYLKTLRIINVKFIPWPDKVDFTIKKTSQINRLEIYATLPITLKLEKNMEKVKLYSRAHTPWVISLTVPSYESAKHFQYYTESGITVDVNDIYHNPQLYKYGRKDFVPNPKYIQ